MVKHISELLSGVNFVADRKPPLRTEGMSDLDYFEKCLYWFVMPATAMTQEQILNAQRQNERKQEKVLAEITEKFHKKLEVAGVDARFYNADINNLQAWNEVHKTKIDIISKNYALGKWLTFVGATGKGKTFIACSMVIDKIKNNKTAEIITSKDLIDKINGTPFERKDIVKGHYAKLDFLVLDEMGRHSDTDNARNIIFDIIKKRHANFMQTVIVSNMSNDELFGVGGFFDEVVSRRVSEEGVTVVFNWGYKKQEDENEVF